MADALASGVSAARHGSSNLPLGTLPKKFKYLNIETFKNIK